MKAEIESELGADVELMSGSGGVFEVSANGRKVFSKKALNRFPHEGEVVSLLKK